MLSIQPDLSIITIIYNYFAKNLQEYSVYERHAAKQTQLLTEVSSTALQVSTF